MDNIADSISSVLPAKYQGLLALAMVGVPLLGRCYHALRDGGGLVGIWNSIVFGTNTSKQVKADIEALKTAAITGNTEFLKKQ